MSITDKYGSFVAKLADKMNDIPYPAVMKLTGVARVNVNSDYDPDGYTITYTLQKIDSVTKQVTPLGEYDIGKTAYYEVCRSLIKIITDLKHDVKVQVSPRTILIIAPSEDLPFSVEFSSIDINFSDLTQMLTGNLAVSSFLDHVGPVGIRFEVYIQGVPQVTSPVEVPQPEAPKVEPQPVEPVAEAVEEVETPSTSNEYSSLAAIPSDNTIKTLDEIFQDTNVQPQSPHGGMSTEEIQERHIEKVRSAVMEFAQKALLDPAASQAITTNTVADEVKPKVAPPIDADAMVGFEEDKN